MKQQLARLVAKALETLNRQILMSKIGDQLLSFPHGWQNPWLSVLISVCTLTEIHLVWILVSIEALRDFKDGVGWDVLCRAECGVLLGTHACGGIWGKVCLE